MLYVKNRFLTLHVEKGASQVKSAGRRAALKFWFRITGAVISLKIAKSEDLYLPVIGGPVSSDRP